tara:strand:+ start:91 stop:264 length:174 start_codon:yes stop_codon:yes gene_type:complete
MSPDFNRDFGAAYPTAPHRDTTAFLMASFVSLWVCALLVGDVFNIFMSPAPSAGYDR